MNKDEKYYISTFKKLYGKVTNILHTHPVSRGKISTDPGTSGTVGLGNLVYNHFFLQERRAERV